MEDVVLVAMERAERFGVGNVVVATNTGESVKRVLEIFGTGYTVFAAGNPGSAHERGLVHHQGMNDETISTLREMGVNVALLDQSFAQRHYDHGGTSRCGLEELEGRMRSPEAFPLMTVICNVLNWFCDSVRVCIEITCLAADAGVLPTDQDCIAIARPNPRSNCPHAAVILRPTTTEEMFKGQLRIKDVALVPGANDHWFSNEPLWQG